MGYSGPWQKEPKRLHRHLALGGKSGRGWAGAGGEGAWAFQQEAAGEFQRLDARAWEFYRAGRYQEMEALGRRLLQMAEGPLRAEPLRRAAALNTLGVALKNQGRHQEAEPLLKEALAILRKVLGKRASRCGPKP